MTEGKYKNTYFCRNRSASRKRLATETFSDDDFETKKKTKALWVIINHIVYLIIYFHLHNGQLNQMQSSAKFNFMSNAISNWYVVIFCSETYFWRSMLVTSVLPRPLRHTFILKMPYVTCMPSELNGWHKP